MTSLPRMKTLPADQRSSGARCCSPVLPARDARRSLALAPLLRVLGDSTRLQIVALLARSDDAMCACEIEATFDLSQPTISHHLRLLKSAGLVTAERRGTWMHYRLERERVDALVQEISLLRGC
jgi:ArsR family transcriptional regulator, arsenate/arsenite/antimonite-responsive transcriptional repressor